MNLGLKRVAAERHNSAKWFPPEDWSTCLMIIFQCTFTEAWFMIHVVIHS